MVTHSQKLVEDRKSEEPNLDHLQARLSLYGTMVTMLSIFLGFLLATVALISFLPQAQSVDLSLRRAAIWVLLVAYYALAIMLVRQHSKTLDEAKVIGLVCLRGNDELMTAGLVLMSLSFSFMVLAGGFTVGEAVLSGIAGAAVAIFGYLKVKKAKKTQK